jgi:hypothetical protein
MQYKPTKNDIQIIIRIKGRNRDYHINSRDEAFSQGLIDPKLIIQVFDSIENALYESDKVDVKTFFNRLNQQEKSSMPPIVEDAAINRIREYRHNRLIVSDAKSGSIEFTTLVVAAAFFVTSKVLEQTISGILEKSEVYQKLLKFTAKNLDSKVLFIAERLRRVFFKKKRDIDVNVIQRKSEEEPSTIEVNIYEELILKEIEYPKSTLGQVIEKERN